MKIVLVHVFLLVHIFLTVDIFAEGTALFASVKGVEKGDFLNNWGQSSTSLS